MKMPASFLAKGAATTMLGACATVSPSDGSSHPLTSHEWKLVEFVHRNDSPIKLPVSMQARHTLYFASDGQVNMMLDCNRGRADWSGAQPVGGIGALTIGPIASTRALCPEPSYGEEMAADLSMATGYSVLPGGGSITIVTPHSVYAFVAADGG